MGNTESIATVSFLELRDMLLSHADIVIINTMPVDMQGCLIRGTVPVADETRVVNSMLGFLGRKKKIIIYGKNHSDQTIFRKYKQLVKLGLEPKLYMGGMFEWLCMRELIDEDLFPVIGDKVDFLEYA